MLFPSIRFFGRLMVPDVSLERYYYIYDSQKHRALVLDRETGEEVPWSIIPRVQLIEHVAIEAGPSVLRRFARWCARVTEIQSVSTNRPAGRLWRAVQDESLSRRSARQEVVEDVVRASALGLPRRRREAAQLLVVHACLHPEPRHAAIDAAHMSERWREFTASSHPSQAVRAMRQRHVDWFLDTLLAV